VLVSVVVVSDSVEVCVSEVSVSLVAEVELLWELVSEVKVSVVDTSETVDTVNVVKVNVVKVVVGGAGETSNSKATATEVVEMSAESSLQPQRLVPLN
jgi:hypothetical protein